MTQPVQEPLTTRSIGSLQWGQNQLFRRPDPNSGGGLNPWVMLSGGATTAPHNTTMPVPFPDICYDPTLVTQGEIFDWADTDTGDPGNPRWEIECVLEGWYFYQLETSWSNVNSDGTEDFAYAMQQAKPTSSSHVSIQEAIRDSADWFMSTVGASGQNGEMTNNPYLHCVGVFHMPPGGFWEPQAIQTTGVDRDLVGEMFYLSFLGADDNADWTCETVP